MPEYACLVGDPDGGLTRRFVVAADPDAARRRLEDESLHVFQVRRRPVLARMARSAARALRARARVPQREVLLFNQQLAALLRAGLPLAESLEIMSDRMENHALRSAVLEILADVRAGAPMSAAVAKHRFFPNVYPASLLAGETSGDLSGMVERFAASMKASVRTRASVVAALVYPAFLLAALVLTAGFLLLYVVPAFLPFFAGFDREVPALTAALLGVAAFIRDRIGGLILSIGLAGFALFFWSRSKSFARFRAGVALRLPFAGPVLRLFGVSQWSRALGTLLAGGMPLASAIPVAARAVGNPRLRNSFGRAETRVREGASFADALDETGEMPGFAVQMARVGENTGDLARMVTSVADFADEAVRYRTEVLLSLLTPVVLVLLGGFVALVLLAIYLPLFGIASAAPAF